MRKGNGPAAYPEDFLLPYEEAMKYFNIALELDALSAAAIEGMNVRRHVSLQSEGGDSVAVVVVRRLRHHNTAHSDSLRGCLLRLWLETFATVANNPVCRRPKLKQLSAARSAVMV